MKTHRMLAAIALLLLPAMARAQASYEPPNRNVADVVTLSPDGSESAPSYSWDSDSTSGLYLDIVPKISVSGTETYSFGADDFELKSDAASWKLGTTGDVSISRSGANTLAFGAGGSTRGSVSSTSSTWTVPFLLGDGSVGAPSFAFSGAATTGSYLSSSGRLAIAVDGVDTVAVGDNTIGLVLDNDAPLAWISSGAAGTGTADLLLSRAAAATLELGEDVNGAPVQQTLKAHDGITGTDVAGANLRLQAGAGTGVGTPGNLVLMTTSRGSTSGTSAQNQRIREILFGSYTDLVDGTATNVVELTSLASSARGGGVIEYSVQATDDTDYQDRSGLVAFATVNKGGTEACALGTPNDVSVGSAGTITVSWDCITTPSNGIIIRALADTSLTATTLRVIYGLRAHGLSVGYTQY